MSANKDRFWLEHLDEAIAFIEKYVPVHNLQALENDEVLYMATVKQIEIIGEAAGNLLEAFKSKHQNIPWKEMKGMRNILVHEYFAIDLETLMETIRVDIPYLKERLKNL